MCAKNSRFAATAIGPRKESNLDVQQRNGSMDRRYPRCGVAAATAAAAALALLTNVGDVQGFAFQLQLPAKQAATSKQRTFMGGGWGASTRGVYASGQGRTSAIASRTSRNTRHARTAVRWEDARLTKRNYLRCFSLTSLLLLLLLALDTTFKVSPSFVCNLLERIGAQLLLCCVGQLTPMANENPCRTCRHALNALLGHSLPREAVKIVGGVIARVIFFLLRRTLPLNSSHFGNKSTAQQPADSAILREYAAVISLITRS